MLKDWKYDWFSNHSLRLSRPLFERVRGEIIETFEIELPEGTKLSTLETYLLADSYVVASGNTAERDILMAREGFCKAAMAAFVILTCILLASVGAGGAEVKIQPDLELQLTWIATAILMGLSSCFAALMWKGFAFYNRLKINGAFTAFLAFKAKDNLKKR